MNAVELHLRDHVAHVRFSRPPVNFFDLGLLTQIADSMDEAAHDGARSIVLSSEGKHFCAGVDFGALGDSVEGRAQEAKACYETGLRILDQPLPVVAATQGASVGGGLGLACTADFRVVDAVSRFEANFSQLGFHQGFALSATLPALVGPQRAARMLYTSARVSGPEAVRIGLADRLAPEGEIVAVAIEMARELAAQAPLAVQAMRRTLRDHIRAQARTVLVRELAEQRRLWATDDAAAGLLAARKRIRPLFNGR